MVSETAAPEFVAPAIGETIHTRDEFAALPTGSIILQSSPTPRYAAKVGRNGWSFTTASGRVIVTDSDMAFGFAGATVIS